MFGQEDLEVMLRHSSPWLFSIGKSWTDTSLYRFSNKKGRRTDAMINIVNIFYRFPSICLIALFTIFFYFNGYASEAQSEASADLKKTPDYSLNIKNNRISLKAKNASVKDIIDQIGKELKIKTDTRIARSAKITVEFNNLTLERALKEISEDYAFFTNKQGKKIEKIVIYPKGEEAPRIEVTPQPEDQQVTQNQSQEKNEPKPFMFEFDPSAVKGEE
jgi:hypothetical protein